MCPFYRTASMHHRTRPGHRLWWARGAPGAVESCFCCLHFVRACSHRHPRCLCRKRRPTDWCRSWRLDSCGVSPGPPSGCPRRDCRLSARLLFGGRSPLYSLSYGEGFLSSPETPWSINIFCYCLLATTERRWSSKLCSCALAIIYIYSSAARNPRAGPSCR